MFRKHTESPNSSSTGANTDTTLGKLKAQVLQRILEEMDMYEARSMATSELRNECRRRADLLLEQQDHPLTEAEKTELIGDILNEIFGLGPLEQFIDDPLVNDILVNGPSCIYIERDGKMYRTQAQFRDDRHLMRTIQRIATQVGRRIDESTPMLDARLMDGSRVNAIIPPLALDGPALSIRRFAARQMTVEELIQKESLASEIATFLKACVQGKMNILISGGTGTGKTTLLNVLSGWIPGDQRLVTIEDAAELRLQQDHVVRLETRPPNIEGKGAVAQRDLLRNSLRMRPDRIIIGEVRGTETVDMLQAMNTGHEGSLTTVHANSPRDALSRIENMVSMAGLNFPVQVIRNQIASAIDVVVHLDRMAGGGRKIVKVAELTGLEGDVICMHDIFEYTQRGVDEERAARGEFFACGIKPLLLKRLTSHGIELPWAMFQKRPLQTRKPQQEE